MSKSSIVVVALLVSIGGGAGLFLAQQPKDIALTAAITLFVAILWITEALPIPATSLIPFAAFPLTGVLTHSEAASSLGSHVIILLMGAFMLSKALEKAHLHQRFAVYMLRLTGSGSAFKLLMGFMLTTALLSMWISNTATVLMILPMALAIIEAMKSKRFGIALILGVAYAASVGGIGTPIGTPPNIIFMSVYEETQGTQFSFIEWMKTGVPIVLLALPFMALWLSRGLSSVGEIDLPKPGTWSKAEKRVLMVFGTVALAWVFRPFWTNWLALTTVSDSTIAIAGVVAMFLIHNGEEKQGRLLDWKTANDIPWGMLLLFAGGICIAKAFKASGLSVLMGEWLTGLSTLPILFLILSICLFVTFLTEITSNTATATLLMPILAAAALAVNVDPKLLMIPAAISASCAFMLPVATAPNAIAFATEKFTIKTMAREGIVLNIIVACITTLVCYVTL
ncbi:SLC13 family permease [Alteromonas sp. ASW11-130]|uniref:SLC13 family permease n=1 Tax=Alteromonas sp. ASW11-130 TaxID=3015775 RepID=UPI002242847B|nr:SLC13 family permease [Alteromonas sp. ASW11-130]MCW8092772.1 SLC13 family permease [Alteromonas sp. ASW11-130]